MINCVRKIKFFKQDKIYQKNKTDVSGLNELCDVQEKFHNSGIKDKSSNFLSDLKIPNLLRTYC